MDMKAGKVHTTITHKRDKNKPRFNFSMVVAGFLVSTTLLSTTLTTPAYAKEVYNASPVKVATVAVTNAARFSNHLEEAKTQTEQLKALIDNGSVDADLLKSIGITIKNADELFCADESIESTDTDIANLKYIWSVYNNTKFDNFTISNNSITTEEATGYVNATKTHVWSILRDSGVNVAASDFTVTGNDNNLYGSMDNFKRSANYRSFSDINSSQWFYLEVIESSKLGLFEGNTDGSFNPDGHLTYAEAVTLAARVHATYYDNKKELDSFLSKPTTNHWADNVVAYANKYGITATVKGVSSLDADCTREQMADLFVSAIVPYTVNSESMFISGIFTEMNNLADAPEATSSPAIQTLFKAGVMVGDDKGFRPASSITRAETACILNRVTTPSKRKAVTPTTPSTPSTPTTPTNPDPGNSSVIVKPGNGTTPGIIIKPGNGTTPGIGVIDIPTTPSTPTKAFSTDIPKDPATGRYIPTNDPTMTAYNRQPLVDFIYTTIQDTYYEGVSVNYQSLYNYGKSLMADEFGGLMKSDFVNGVLTYENGVYCETLLVPEGTSNVSRETFDIIQAGDYITLHGWLNATMLVAERKPNSVIVIEPTAGSNGSTPFRWREYTFDQLASKLIARGEGALHHLEFNNLQ